MQLRQHLFIVFGAIGLVLAFLVSPRLVGQFLAVDRELAHLIHHLRLIVAAMGVTLIACGMVRSSMQPVFFAIPIVSLFLFVIARSMIRGADQGYLLLISEDGPVEYVSCVLFAFASFFAAMTALKFLTASMFVMGGIYAGLSAFLLFVALEEINYGQRIFAFSTPSALVERNRQGEFNFHNLRSLEWYVLNLGSLAVALYGLFGWMIGAALAKTARTAPSARKLRPYLAFLFPGWWMSLFFLPLALYNSYWFVFPSSGFLIWQDQEPAEMFAAFGLLLFTLSSYQRISGGWLTFAFPRRPSS